MNEYDFQLILADTQVLTEEIPNALIEAGDDDGTPFSSEGRAGIVFTRLANSMK